jgi:hypothetical protein
MKGNPYKMGKMATKSSMKMKKEAMAKMKKESMAKLKDESAMKLKTSYKMKEAMAKMKDKSAAKQTKPDFPDIDGDGNTKESMKQAAADKKSMAKMKKGEAMKMKKESMAKQTKKQKEKLPTGLVKEIAKKAGKAGTAVAREGIKAAGSKVAGKTMTKKLETKKAMTKKLETKKSPMEQGKTKFIDKVKAAGRAIAKNIGNTGSGPREGMGPKVQRSYDKYKKEYRKAAAAKSSK